MKREGFLPFSLRIIFIDYFYFSLFACKASMWAKVLFSPFNVSGEPVSITAPSSRTTILSACVIVRMRWAIMSTVLLRTSSDRAACIFVSFSTSREAVASSSKTIGASFKRARAMEIRCRSPPYSVSPFSPMMVW